MQVLDSKPSVVARNLEKTFFLNSRGSEVGFTKGRRSIKVEALKPASFVVSAGESIGVIGKNGSGKSTLLALIAGHLRPTGGDIKVSARPSLLTVGAAQQQQLSGRDNVRLGLLSRGLSISETRELEAEVAEWADIGEAIDRPVETLSSGQRARLNFAIATAVRAEILLVDEALSTGDAAFAFKAKKRMLDMLDSSGTVFVVSHAPGTIERYCNRCLWMHDGALIADGPAKTVTYHYRNWTKLTAHPEKEHALRYVNSVRQEYTRPEIEFKSQLD